MKRRHFLQAASSTVATLAFSQWDIIRQGDRYAKVLAQDTPRKLALLVGINYYLGGDRDLYSLDGCLTDVDLQRELLTHRFGFNDKDIFTLQDREATRDKILSAFETHLIEQAKPGDVVVFHFSGHGSQILDPDPINGQPLNSTFVPAGAVYRNPDGSVDDIMGRTLFLLTYALKTDNVTAVLDCCHAGGGTRGTAKIRAGDGGADYKPSAAELAYQERWLKKLNLSHQEFQQKRTNSVAKGAVLAGSLREQQAQDWWFPAGFHAGAFTYLLTQYLWEQTAAIGDAQMGVRRSLKSLTQYQEPVFDLQQPNLTAKPLYFTAPKRGSAQAVVTEIKGTKATLWLGGLDYPTLGGFAPGSTFAILDEAGRSVGNATLESREGLTAIASVKGAARRGTLLQESTRVIPSDLRLRIGLDRSLGNELASVQAALSQITRIEAIPAQTDATYPTGVHYILSRVTKEYQVLTNKPPIDSVALFLPNLDLLPNSFEKAGESAQEAIKRLTPKLQSLVATHLVRQTLNANASNLNVEVQMHRQNQPEFTIAKASTGVGRNSTPAPIRNLSLGTPFQFQVVNREATPLYLLIALVSPSGRLSILFPNVYTDGDLNEISQVSPQSHRFVPDPNDGDAFQLIPQLVGRGEALIIASRKPLDTAYKRLQTLAAEQSTQRGPINLERGADAIADLLSDLSTRSNQSAYSISTNDVATLAIAFEIM